MAGRAQRALFLVLASGALLTPPQARGDGCIFGGRDLSALRPLRPNEQVAAIAHKDGTQRMVIALNFDLEDQENAR